MLNWLGILAAFGNMILSGISAVIYKSQGEKIKPALMVVINSVISWLAFIILVSAMGDFQDIFSVPLFPFLAFVFAAIMGIIVGNYFYLISMQLIGVSKAYPITMTYPFLTYILEILFLGATFNWKKAAGIVLIIVGVVLISFSKINVKENDKELFLEKEPAGQRQQILEKPSETAAEGLPDTSSERQIKKDAEDTVKNPTKRAAILGVILATLSSITWASGSTLIKYGLNNTDVGIIPINAGRLLILIPLSVALFYVTKEHKKVKKITWKSFALVALAALLSLFVANICYLKALDLIGTSTPSAIAASGPLVATPLSILFLKEKVDWKIILGTVLTIGGNILVILIL
ncbi:MAG: DMT family transporter [Candidatus Heimdallarchaeota archaeon]